MPKTFNDLTKDEIADILNTAMDDKEWHTPYATDINIKVQDAGVVYGWCNISKHSTFHDIEHWFNINSNNVAIWKKEYGGIGRIEKSLHRPVYNFKELGNILSELEFKISTQ